MEFLKNHWATLTLVGIIAVYFGVSMGTNGCPMCVAGNAVAKVFGHDSDSVSTSGKVVTETQAADWSATRLDGTEMRSEDLKGKVAVVVYWATWCSPCIKEIPTLVALRNEFDKERVEILGVSVDSPGKDLEPFISSKGINYEIARQSESMEKAFGQVRYLPTMFILDKKGKVHYQHTGLVSHDVIQDQIQSLLTQNA